MQFKKRAHYANTIPLVIMVALIIIVSFLIIIFYHMAVTTGGEPECAISSSDSDILSKTSSIETSNEMISSVLPSSNASSIKPSSVTSSKPTITSSKPKPSSSKLQTASSLPVESIASKQEETQPQETSSEPATLSDGELPVGSISDWNLILLNPEQENKITEELGFDKTKFDYNQCVDSRAADPYIKMRDDAKKEGITLFLRSGYRSMNTQRVNYNANVQCQLNLGYSKDEAIKSTNLYYTVPGHSEHHSGLAFDIITPEYHKNTYSLDERFAKTKAYEWLKTNCTSYGFILRYPKEKKDITTINFEPWHYRYVGIEHAKYIVDNNLCFEEYIQLLKDAGR